MVPKLSVEAASIMASGADHLWQFRRLFFLTFEGHFTSFACYAVNYWKPFCGRCQQASWCEWCAFYLGWLWSRLIQTACSFLLHYTLFIAVHKPVSKCSCCCDRLSWAPQCDPLYWFQPKFNRLSKTKQITFKAFENSRQNGIQKYLLRCMINSSCQEPKFDP